MGTVETTMVPVDNLIDMVLKLPEIQRQYVWNRPQIRDLLDSLYRGYPVGTILLWDTGEAPVARSIAVAHNAPDSALLNGNRFLLDGQQRITSLTKSLRTVSEGGVDVRFNFETEEFQIANAVIKQDPRFVSVRDVCEQGPIAVAGELELFARTDAQEILNRLNHVYSIGRYQVPVHVLKDFNYEEVTDIFLRVNSKGTRLREAELAIARLAFRLPGMITDELGRFEDELDSRHYEIDLRFLVRFLTAVATGQSRFPPLSNVPEVEIASAWQRTRKATEYFVNLLTQNLGIESTDWLPSMNAMIVPITYLARVTQPRDVDTRSLLRWFVLASTWQRYAGAAETTMDQDLRVLDEPNPFALLVHDLLQKSGRLQVSAEDLDDVGITSPLFLATYLACRNNGATDWWFDVKLSSTNLGTDHLLEIHHIFPKALVRREGYPRRDINELANLAFLSKRANIGISADDPGRYLSTILSERLKSQFVPLDPTLWSVDRFQEFLGARRQLLAEGINAFLKTLE